MTNPNPNGRVFRLTTEPKAAFKTTEFIAYVVILIAMFIASAVIDDGEDGRGFGASQVWLYTTILTVGYMISRGLAKSGKPRAMRQRQPRWGPPLTPSNTTGTAQITASAKTVRRARLKSGPPDGPALRLDAVRSPA